MQRHNGDVSLFAAIANGVGKPNIWVVLTLEARESAATRILMSVSIPFFAFSRWKSHDSFEGSMVLVLLGWGPRN